MAKKRTLIKLRRGSASEWTASNEILSLGEPGFETDTNKLKIGDGVTEWNDLPYINDDILSINDALLFKGTLGTGGTIEALPSVYEAGWVYKVITPDTYANKVCEFGDLIIAIVDRLEGGGNNNDWVVVQANIDGAVTSLGGTTNKLAKFSNGLVLADSIVSDTSGVVTVSGNLIANSGSFTNLSVNSILVSLSGHSHVSSDITDFDQAVQDNLNTSLVGGSGIELIYDSISDTLTIGTTGVSFVGHSHVSSDITDFNSSVSGLLPSVSGSGFVNSSFSNNAYTISVSGLQPSGNYSIEGHTHIISEVSGLQDALDSKQPSGVYASGVHSHEVSDITDFNSGVSGLLPVKDVIAGSGIDVGVIGSDYTISVSGLDSSYISDFNEAVDDRVGSGLFVAGTGINLNYNDVGNSFTVSVSGLINNPTNNRILTSRDSTTTGIDAETNLTFDGSLLSVSGNLVVNSGTLNSITFNNIGDPSLSARQLAWNSSEGSLALALSNTYDMYLGGELHYRVRNETGAPIIAGTAVYASGVAGGSKRITVAPKAADGSIRETRFMGLVTENINNGVNGFTTYFGYIRNIDTRGDYAANGATNKVWASGEPVWAEGDILYIHPTVEGKLTKIEPKHSISVAIILNRHQSEGKLFVRPTSYGHLDDNHDVAVSGATNGQFLQYNSATDYWVPSSSGNFTSLSVNNTIVSVSGHTHTSSNITDFNSSVSGLLPSVSGSGFVNSSFDNNVYTISVTGLQPSGNYSIEGHTHIISEVSGLQDALDSKQPSGVYASGVHSHEVSDITDFNSGVSGLLPVKDIIAGSGIDVGVVGSDYTISVSGLDSSYITDFNTSVSGLLPTVSNSGDNRILTSDGSSTGINAESNLTFDGTNLNVSGVITATSGVFTERLDAPLSYYTVDPAVSGTVDDWNPGATADVVRASGISSARINGLVDNYGADAVLLYNVGSSGNIILTHASGTTNNQFLVPWLGDYVLSPNGGAALIVRDKVDNKWRIT